MQEIEESIDGAKERLSPPTRVKTTRDSVILQFLCPKGTSSKTHWFRRLEEKKERFTSVSFSLCTQRARSRDSRDFVTSGGPVTEISSVSQKTSLHGKKNTSRDFKMQILIHDFTFSWFFRIQTHLLPKRNMTVMKFNSNMQVDGHTQQLLTNQHLQGKLKIFENTWTPLCKRVCHEKWP